METVLVEKIGQVMHITMNRPEKRNAFSNLLWKEFSDALVQFDEDDSMCVAIITANGPCFCAGSDIKELALGTHKAPEGREDWGFAGLTRHTYKKPIIACVHGAVYGGGLELMMACDLVVAVRSAKFALPEPTIGAMAENGFVNVINQIPFRIALELLFTGEPIDSERAWNIGLINRIVESEEELLPEALKIAEKICQMAPLPIEFSKEIATRCQGLPSRAPSAAWDVVDEVAVKLYASHDFAEGTNAFREKRKPVWTGK